MKKILVISAGRSDYDRYYPIISELNKKKRIKLWLCLTRSHQENIFGKTINYISKEFNIFKNSYKSKKIFNNDFSKNFCDDLLFINEKIKKKKPDLIIILGDRYEMMLGPISAIPYNIPVIHFFGGAVTEGATDELVRHAITKMSHYHFVLLDQYKKRLKKMGEESWRIKTIGMHELFNLKKQKMFNLSYLNKKYKFNFNKPYILFTLHPTTLELKSLRKQIQIVKNSLIKSNLNVVFTYPNADPGFETVINFIKTFRDKKKYIVFKNAGINLYANLLKNATLLLGNTSSGIVEAASFKKPVINLGTRQKGKYTPKNVINCDFNSKKIMKSIAKAMSKNFNDKIKNLINPYESKIKINEIIKIILKISNNDKILRKKFID
tara:strand:- start:6595 stop:7734 length:1140 start_codon:yes stop_codon:yes gene_type:complete